MSSNMRAVLAAANITCGEWIVKYEKNNAFAFPLLAFTARDNDRSALSTARCGLKKTDHYMAAGTAEKEKMVKDIEEIMIQKRTEKGIYWKVIALKLGHRDVNGVFWFEQKNAIAASCILCGMNDHTISTCTYYVAEILTPDTSIIIHPTPDVPLPIIVIVPAPSCYPLSHNPVAQQTLSNAGNVATNTDSDNSKFKF